MFKDFFLKCLILYIPINILLFKNVSLCQNTNNSVNTDSSVIPGKFALDFMTWVGYTDAYSYTPLWPPYKVVNKPDGYSCAFKDVSYRLKLTYKLYRFRVGFDLLINEILMKEVGKYVTNGFQAISVTSDFTVLKRNRFDIGCIMAVGIYHNKYYEDVSNDFLQVGIISSYSLTPNISVLLSPVYSFNSIYQGTKKSILINGGIRFIPSKTDFGVKKINRETSFSVAIASNINLTKQNTIILYKPDGYTYAIWPYLPVWVGGVNGTYIENNYKNAFAAPNFIFPVIEIGINNHKSSHLFGAGFSKVSDSYSLKFPDCIVELSLKNQRFYYQYDHTIFSKCRNNYSNCSVLPYVGAQLMLNLNKAYWGRYSNVNLADLAFHNIEEIYKDSTILLEPQFLLGIRSNHNRIFFDTGICFNLIAKEFIKSNFSKYDHLNCVVNENYNMDMALYINDLWKNKYLFDNIYFKIGYRF